MVLCLNKHQENMSTAHVLITFVNVCKILGKFLKIGRYSEIVTSLLVTSTLLVLVQEKAAELEKETCLILQKKTQNLDAGKSKADWFTISLDGSINHLRYNLNPWPTHFLFSWPYEVSSLEETMFFLGPPMTQLTELWRNQPNQLGSLTGGCQCNLNECSGITSIIPAPATLFFHSRFADCTVLKERWKYLGA